MKIDNTNTKTNSIAKYLWSGHKISTRVGWKRSDKKVKNTLDFRCKMLICKTKYFCGL